MPPLRPLGFLAVLTATVVSACSAAAPEPKVFEAGLLSNPGLSDLEGRMPDTNYGDMRAFIYFSRKVASFVETNQLETGNDFLRAAKLMSTVEYDFRIERVRYELLLAAVAKDEPGAAAPLPEAWNSLLGTLGRPLRLEFAGLTARNPDAGENATDPAPAFLQAVMKDPVQARADAAKATDNAALQQLVDVGEAERKNLHQPPTDEEIKALLTADRERTGLARELVVAAALHTAKDFANASLLLQHSESFAGYELAHELAVCSLLLGDRDLGRSLVSATYDRLLNSTGHDQRFATQYGPEGLLRVDEAGICDAERIALGRPTLAEARKKK